MYVDDCVYWYVESDIGSEVGRVVNRGADSDIDDEVRSSDKEGFELEFGD